MSNSVDEQSWWLRIFRSTTWLDSVESRGFVPFLVGRDLLHDKKTMTVLALRFGRKTKMTPESFAEVFASNCYELFVSNLRDCTKLANGTFYLKERKVLLYTGIFQRRFGDRHEDKLGPEYLDDWTRLCVLATVASSKERGSESVGPSSQTQNESHLANITHHSLGSRLYRSYLKWLHSLDSTAENLEANITLQSAAICYTDEAEMVRQISAASSKYGIIFNLPRGFCIDSAWKPKIRNVSILLLGSKEYSNDRRLRL